MKSCFILVFNLLLLTSLLAQQEVLEKLDEPTCIQFKNNIYVSGYEQSGQELQFKLRKYNTKLEKTGEESKVLGKHKSEDFHAPVFDTTHGFLNLTVQKKNNDKTATLFRYNENLKPLAFIENAEITRINSFAAFDLEKIYYKNRLFVIRPSKDSVGKFYFFRYDLKDSSTTFNYDFKWQFNFDQHNYHRIHLIEATANYVYAYVICLDGDKKGQWLITFNTEDGSIAKAVKLNKNDNEFYFVGKILIYNQTQDVAISGVKYPAASVDLKTGKFGMNYQTSKTLNIFFCTIDSAGEIKQRSENYITVPNELLKEKELKEFILRTDLLQADSGNFSIVHECLYKAPDGLYKTYGFLFSRLNTNPENILKQDNNAFLPCYRNEKKNPNAKQTTNQYDNEKPDETDRLFYKNAFTKNFSEAGVLFDAAKKTACLISYYENKKINTLTFHKNSMKSYAWETSSLKTSNDYSDYNVFSVGENKFIIFISSKDKTGFTLSYFEF